MSADSDGVIIHIANLNVCLGGRQVVTGGSADETLVSKKVLKLRRTTGANNHTAARPTGGEDWYVMPVDSQIGKITASVSFPQPVPSGSTVYARVYAGDTDPGAAAFEAGLCVAGTPSTDRRTWTWADGVNLVGYAAHAAAGVGNFLVFWVVTGTTATHDPPNERFVGRSASGYSGYSGTPAVKMSPAHGHLADKKSLELTIADGPFAGRYTAGRVGGYVWEVLEEKLGGPIRLTFDGGRLCATTPHGEGAAPPAVECPFAVVLPGSLFLSSRDAVVTVA